jgi:hypothetical protein
VEVFMLVRKQRTAAATTDFLLRRLPTPTLCALLAQ